MIKYWLLCINKHKENEVSIFFYVNSIRIHNHNNNNKFNVVSFQWFHVHVCVVCTVLYFWLFRISIENRINWFCEFWLLISTSFSKVCYDGNFLGVFLVSNLLRLLFFERFCFVLFFIYNLHIFGNGGMYGWALHSITKIRKCFFWSENIVWKTNNK